jgi:hypothetical protein
LPHPNPDKEVRIMVKLAIGAFLLLTTTTVSWTGYRALSTPSQTPQAVADDPLASEAAYRHRNGLPTHWRGYVLQRSF